ncbi:MAG: zinc ribbon domain-containing protein [Solobacterium sp.]|nr:zinc ribbon domain-containing protein [Solobacterium sp.]
MKYCPSCGTKLEGNPKYCYECGSPTLEETPTPKSDNLYSSKNQTLLIDYFEKTLGTPVEMPYYELCLYTYSPTQLLLEEYTQGGSPNEVCRQKLVSHEVYKEALKIVTKHRLKQSVDYRGRALNGKTFVIKFRESMDDQTLYRFSDENLHEKQSFSMFTEMSNLLKRYVG